MDTTVAEEYGIEFCSW